MSQLVDLVLFGQLSYLSVVGVEVWESGEGVLATSDFQLGASLLLLQSTDRPDSISIPTRTCGRGLHTAL